MNKNFINKIITTCLFLLLCIDIVYSFFEHYSVPLDGDMPTIILPSESNKTVLNDPFGFNVLLHDSVYVATNRFFAHWTMRSYFRTMPFFFQKFTNPVNSVYLSCALAKTVIQILIIYLLSIYISGKSKIFDKDFLLAAILITPLFQAFGYNGQMGIIDKSITYTFFYAFPLSLVLIFFLPYFLSVFHNKKLKSNLLYIFLSVILLIILSFNGPLNPAVVLLICILIFIYSFFSKFFSTSYKSLTKNFLHSFKKSFKDYPVLFLIAIAVCLYSFYIGLNNSDSIHNSISLSDRYTRLPYGFKQFVQRPGPSLLLMIIIINTIIISRQKSNPQSKRILMLLKWIGLFSAIYILLLPLGGYRTYRPGILRRDTIMPVMFCLFFFYGISSYYLIRQLTFNHKKLYFTVLIIFMLTFTFADTTNFKSNHCERKSLELLAQSKEKIVPLKEDCTVMSWNKFTEYGYSYEISELLEYWGIVKKCTWFYWE